MVAGKKMAAVAAWSVLGASGIVAAQDAAGLLQADLHVHSPGEPVQMTRDTSGTKYMVKSKTMGRALLRALLSDGDRWWQFVWGNKTERVASSPVPVRSGGAPGCTAEDQKSAAAHFKGYQEEFANHVRTRMPGLVEQAKTVNYDFKLGAVPFVPIDRNNVPSGHEANVLFTDLVTLPELCHDLFGTAAVPLSWVDLLFCARSAFGVSPGCTGCLASFSAEIQNDCSVCSDPTKVFSRWLKEAEADLDKKFRFSKNNLFGTEPAALDETQRRIQVTSDVFRTKLQTFVPCFQCLAPRATRFAKCAGGESLAATVEKIGQDVIQEVADGSLLHAQIGEASHMGARAKGDVAM